MFRMQKAVPAGEGMLSIYKGKKVAFCNMECFENKNGNFNGFTIKI